MSYLPGEILRCRYPFTDVSGTKRRLAIVLADDGLDVVVLRVTSHPPRPGTPDVPVEDWAQAGLRQRSTVRLKPATLDSALIFGKAVGHLSPADWAAVQVALVRTWIEPVTVAYVTATMSLTGVPPVLLETLAVAAVRASVGAPGVSLEAIRAALPPDFSRS